MSDERPPMTRVVRFNTAKPPGDHDAHFASIAKRLNGDDLKLFEKCKASDEGRKRMLELTVDDAVALLREEAHVLSITERS